MAGQVIRMPDTSFQPIALPLQRLLMSVRKKMDERKAEESELWDIYVRKGRKGLEQATRPVRTKSRTAR